MRLYSMLAAGGAALCLCVLFACGARTGLLLPSQPTDAGADAPLFGEQSLDVQVKCDAATYCEASDPGRLYECGTAIFQCGSLEQCEVRGGHAECINPCVDSLGNNTSNGCEFYAAETDMAPEAAGVCYAAFIVNQWPTGEPARIEVTRGGVVLPVEQFARIPVGTGTGITYGPFKASAGLPPNQVAILFLSRDPAALDDPNSVDPRVLANCPAGVTPAVVGDTSVHGTGRGTAFRIRSNVPIVAYQMLPYGGGSARVTGGTLLLPTSAWGLNYVIADAYRAPTLIDEARAGPTTLIVASQDSTHVTVKPTTDILAGDGVLGTSASVPVTYTLSSGEYVQVTQASELTGSAVESDKPVAVIGASTLMDLPLDHHRADSAEQMLPPVQSLGSEYVAVRYRSRGLVEESVPWRIVGAVNGTRLSYEPAPPSGAPRTLDAEEFVEFTDPGPFVVRSQDVDHPFYVASYMTGGEPFDGAGDPDFVNVVPPAQYLPRYTFFTDPTYPETNLVVVRQRDAATGQMPEVTLDCAGTLRGWQPVGTGKTYEMTRADLSTGDFKGVGRCDNGVHSVVGSFANAGSGATQPVPRFGVTVWGWGNAITWPTDETVEDELNPKFTRWVSYGYPAGADFKRLNQAVLHAR